MTQLYRFISRLAECTTQLGWSLEQCQNNCLLAFFGILFDKNVCVFIRCYHQGWFTAVHTKPIIWRSIRNFYIISTSLKLSSKSVVFITMDCNCLFYVLNFNWNWSMQVFWLFSHKNSDFLRLKFIIAWIRTALSLMNTFFYQYHWLGPVVCLWRVLTFISIPMVLGVEQLSPRLLRTLVVLWVGMYVMSILHVEYIMRIL